MIKTITLNAKTDSIIAETITTMKKQKATKIGCNSYKKIPV